MAESQNASENTLMSKEPITTWYHEHEDQYQDVEARLAAVNDKFLNAERDVQVKMLRLSYVNAVMSIQTRVEDHEKAYRTYVAGASVYEALRYTNFGGDEGKGSWVKATFSDESHFHDVIDLLEADKIDKAHRFMIDNWTGVAATKAAFVLAMLGFTQKMCLDVNVRRILGLEYGDTVVVSKYDGWCGEIHEKFGEPLGISRFLTQWLIFDYARGNHSTHDIFFNSLGIE